MLRRHEVHLISNPYCSKSVDTLSKDEFRYYDKDGFELNIAERKFYSAMCYPIHNQILNHSSWQEPWFELEDNDQGLIIDHSIFLCRCGYTGDAESQLKEIKKSIPTADFLLNTKPKWGFDFALDAIRDNRAFEVIHVEYDHNVYDKFTERFISFEQTVFHTDWNDCANRVWSKRDQWQHLKGFDQNHWKAQYLLGWQKSEYLEKAI